MAARSALLAAMSGPAADLFIVGAECMPALTVLSKTENIMDSFEFESRLHELKARAHGWDISTTFKRVEECVGSVARKPRPQPGEHSAQRKKDLAKRLWEEAKPISTGDDV